MYGAMDNQGLCFFLGPSVDSLKEISLISNQIGFKTSPAKMIRASANDIKTVYDFNKKRGVKIQPLPEVFYQTPTHGNSQLVDDVVNFCIPFDTIKNHGEKILSDVAEGTTDLPDNITGALDI